MNFNEVSKSISECIERTVSIDDIIGVQDKLIDLGSMIALSAQFKSAAKKRLCQKELEVLNKYKDSGLSPTIISKYLNAEAFEEQGWYIYADRLNAGISHEMDSLRSIISLYKEELKQLN